MQANREPSTADEPGGEPVDARVRRRLRELRLAQGLTLSQVADRANIDLSTLSRLESGKRRLALDHIQPLAAALGTSTDQLLGSVPRPDPRVRSEPRTRDGLTMLPLTRRAATGGLQAYKVAIHRQRATPPERLPVHPGHMWIYVLSGRLRLLLGDDEFAIEPGEAVEFNTQTPHWFGVIDGVCECVMIVGPQGERMYLHGAPDQ